MKSWTVIVIGLAIYFAIVGVGVPFGLKAGQVNRVGSKLHFTASTQGLAAIIRASHRATVSCGDAQVCVAPTHETQFQAYVPILFEPCGPRDAERLMQSCESGELSLELTSRSWILSSLRIVR